MCTKCQNLEIYKAISSWEDLKEIIPVLKQSFDQGNVKITCMETEKEIFEFDSIGNIRSENDVIYLKVYCIQCGNRFQLFTDTGKNYFGFFSPNRQELEDIMYKHTVAS